MKLYKKQEGILHYWQTWNKTQKSGTIHWGVVGERGSTEKISASSQIKYNTLVQAEIEKQRKNGFAESIKELILVIEYEAKIMSLVRLKRLHRLGERLDHLLGWTGLGHHDGNSFGSGKMDVSAVVVDYEIAKKAIMADLEDTEFAKYIDIRQEGDTGDE